MTGPHGSPGTPRVARALLRLRVPRDERPFVLADLDDRFEELCASRGLKRARRWYWRQAIIALVGWRRWPRGRSNPLISGIGTDMKAALRACRRRPGQAAFTSITLALGIGLTAAAVSILHGTVLRGLPFEDAHHLVHFERSNPSQGQLSMAVTPHDYVDWSSRQRSFEALGAYVEAVGLFPNEGAPPTRLAGVSISPGSFPLLGVEAAHGRTFSLDDERLGAPRVILLSHALWTRRFGADPAVVGQPVRMNGEQWTVAGVMPAGFGFPIAEQFWIPLVLDLSIQRGTGRLDVFGRLVDGADIETARAEFGEIAAQLQTAYPESNEGVEAVLKDFTEEYVGPDFVRTVYGMLAAAALVLLLCCANVTTLLLGHTFRRRQDLVVRTALGATGSHLVRQLLVEVGLLAALGAVGGVVVAEVGTRWFRVAGAQAGVFALPHGPDSLFWWDVAVDGTTLGAILVLALLSTLAAGLIPALRGARAASASAARSGGSVSRHSPAAFVRRLVIGEIALSTALLVAAGFVVQSALRVTGADDGFDSEGVVVTRVDLPVVELGGDRSPYATMEAQIDFARRLVDRIEGDPTVDRAAVATEVPLDPPSFIPFSVEGAPTRDVESPPVAGVVTVTPGYFDVFGLSPLRGRGLASGDRQGSLPVALVNRSFADRYLPSPGIGARIQLGRPEDGDPWLTVVGIVPDLWNRRGNPAENAGVYVPVAQSNTARPAIRTGWWGLRYQTLVIRSRGAPEAVARPVRDAVFAEDPTVPVRPLRTMAETVATRMGRYGVWGRFYLVFAAVALFLAAVGIYGVLSFGVESRTSEIGIRRALGASVGTVQNQVVKTALARILIGSGLGLLLGYWVSQGLRRVLYEVEPTDPRVFAGVVALLALVGLLASWIPARRAARIHPADAVREG